MSIKVSDIMLDLNTGDASPRDAYIQEAMGQVKVSSAIYDAAKQIAFLEPSEMTEVIQEAATNAGLPTDRENAVKLMFDAAEHQVLGTLRHFYQENAKVVETEKVYAALNALGKYKGVKMPLDGSTEYAGEFANKVMPSKPVELGGAKFLGKKAAKAKLKKIIDATVQIANVAGIDCDELKNDKTINNVDPVIKNCNLKKDEDGCITVACMAAGIENASDDLAKAEIKDSDYVSTVKKDDVATLVACNFAVVKVSKFIQKKFAEDASKLETAVKKSFKKQKKDKPTDSIDQINEKCPEVNQELNDAISSMIKACNDSFTVLLEEMQSGEEDK